MISIADEARTVRLSAAAFSVDAVKRAAYALMARYDASVAFEGDDIVCTLLPATLNTPMDYAERDFRREVVDQDLRISIERQTEAYRDTILGLAFSRTGLQSG
jgi:His-Xaa-Ser system protein HxsD